MKSPEGVLAKLIKQHRLAFAKLHGELEVALDATGARWSKDCPDPTLIQGGTFCGDMRTKILQMNGIHARSRSGDSPGQVPAHASCGPGSTLVMTTGPNSSVRIGDVKKVGWARVRHLPPKKAEEAGACPPPKGLPEPRPGVQLAFDAVEMESEVQIMGPDGIGDRYELIVYWWESPGRLSVAGAILAMVADIGTNDERIVAFVKLPPAIRPQTVAELAAVQSSGDDEDRRDFEQWLPESPSGTGDSEA